MCNGCCRGPTSSAVVQPPSSPPRYIAAHLQLGASWLPLHLSSGCSARDSSQILTAEYGGGDDSAQVCHVCKMQTLLDHLLVLCCQHSTSLLHFLKLSSDLGITDVAFLLLLRSRLRQQNQSSLIFWKSLGVHSISCHRVKGHASLLV